MATLGAAAFGFSLHATAIKAQCAVIGTVGFLGVPTLHTVAVAVWALLIFAVDPFAAAAMIAAASCL